MLYRGDCLEVLKTLEANSIDSLITDPPAGISFMGKDWDSGNNFIPVMIEIFKEALRVLKPGAHGLVWALPRTSHWTATALEQAGFEIRDVVTHLFGSGFPKSLDISKAIDKAAGVERDAVPLVRCDGRPQHNKEGGGWKQNSEKYVHHPVGENSTDEAKQWQGWGTALKPASEHWILVRKKYNIDPCEEIVLSAIPNTQLTMHGLNEAEALLVHMLVESSLDPAQKAKILCVGRAVNGLDMTVMSQLTSVVESIDLNIVSSWKNISDEDLEKVKTFITSMVTRRITESRISNSSQSPNTLDCIKPNSEHYILIRKPLSEKTVAANVLKHGTGGINIDACRIESTYTETELKRNFTGFGRPCENKSGWMFRSKEGTKPNPSGRFPANLVLDEEAAKMLDEQSGISKTCRTTWKAKPSLSGNGITMGKMESKTIVNPINDSGGASRFFYCAKASKKDRNEGLEGMPEKLAGCMSGPETRSDRPANHTRRANHHPTVKSTKLMEYLIKLITPPNGVILDPFMGSGSTGVAAKRLGFEFVGIEKNEEYFEIAEKRIATQHGVEKN